MHAKRRLDVTLSSAHTSRCCCVLRGKRDMVVGGCEGGLSSEGVVSGRLGEWGAVGAGWMVQDGVVVSGL